MALYERAVFAGISHDFWQCFLPATPQAYVNKTTLARPLQG